MGADLMAGYVAYTNIPDILAEAQDGYAAEPELKSISVTVTMSTFSVTL